MANICFIELMTKCAEKAMTQYMPVEYWIQYTVRGIYLKTTH